MGTSIASKSQPRRTYRRRLQYVGRYLNGTLVYRIKSRRLNDGTTYLVTVNERTGKTACNCPATRPCWHIDRVLSHMRRPTTAHRRSATTLGRVVSIPESPSLPVAYQPKDLPTCALCGSQDAPNYTPLPDSVPGAGLICKFCAIDQLALDEPDWTEEITDAERAEEAAYWQAMDAAESAAAHVEAVAQREAAEHEDEMGAGE